MIEANKSATTFAFVLFTVLVFLTVNHLSLAKKLDKIVLAYHPSWSGDEAGAHYDWDAISTLAYYGYEVEPSSISSSYKYDWASAGIIDSAKAHGVRAALTVALSGTEALTQLLGDTSICEDLIRDLIKQLKLRNAGGINIDFEGIPGALRDRFTDFARRLRAKFDIELPGTEISAAGPAVDWNDSWDFPNLSKYFDYIVLMGYDYHWSSGETAGPVAPLGGYYYDVGKSVSLYLQSGCPANKILLGVPWYGYDWPCKSEDRNSETLGKGVARRYYTAEKMKSEYGRTFDTVTHSSLIIYRQNDTVHQLWYDDSLSLSYKYALVNDSLLAGIGIWAVGYEGDDGNEMWEAIENSFSTKTYVNDFSGSDLTVYPQPSHGKIRIDGLKTGEYISEIISVWGEHMPVNAEGNIIDLSNFAKGIYLLIIAGSFDRPDIKFLKVCIE